MMEDSKVDKSKSSAEKLRLLLERRQSLKEKSMGKMRSSSEDFDPRSLGDFMNILEDAEKLIKDLKEQNFLYQNSLAELKTRTKEVILENETLHKRLNVRSSSDDMLSNIKVGQNMDKIHLYDPEYELDEVKRLNQEKTDRLDIIIKTTRKQLEASRKQIAKLQSQLRAVGAENDQKKETVCIKCGSHSYFSHHPSKAHETTLELLFRERDELVEMLSKQNSMLEQCEHREFQAMVQAKKLAESTENANLEKAKAIIRIKQLESSLENERKRLDMEREKNQREINGIVERLDKKKKEFSDKIEILTQKCDEKDHHYEQLSREKENLLCNYEKTAVELQTAHMEMSKLRVECHEEMVKMTRKLTEVTEELSRLKNDKNRKDKDNEQIKISLKMEIENLKHRLMEAHNECVETREKNVKIDEKLKRTENELHQLVLSKNSYEKTQEENREFYEKQDEQREKIFLDSLQETEQKHIVLRKKLEKMLEAQMKMTSDLKEENKRLLIKLEDKTKSHKSEKSKWMNDMSTLKQELEKTREQYEVISNEKSVLIQKKRNISEKITFFKTENKKSRNLIYSLLQKQKLLMMERRSLSYELLQQNRLAGSSFQRHFVESIPVHYERESDVVSNNNDIINHEEIDENNHKENDSL